MTLVFGTATEFFAAGLRIASRVQVAVRRHSPIPRVAFGITVIGILVGMLAFGLAIVRERIYAQDYSDLEYDAAARLAGAAR